MKDVGLSETNLEAIVSTLNNHPKVNRVILFGSRAKGNYEAGSDIDLALSGDDLVTNDIIDLSNQLDNLDLPYKIDLVIFHRINDTPLKEHIERVGIVLYSK